MRTTTGVMVAVMLLVLCRPVHADDSPVRLGQISISFYAVAGQIVQLVLERLGHRVDLVTGSHGEIFPALSDGKIDLLVAAWLPHAHGSYWVKHGHSAVELGVLYRGAQLFWAVPQYVPLEQVGSVSDLTRPEIRGVMHKRIQSTKPDSGLTIGSRKVMDAYGLEDYGYRLHTGQHGEWQHWFQTNYDAGTWFVIPYFRPNFLNRMVKMRKLDEPQELLGKENRAALVAQRAFLESAPRRMVAILRRIELDLDAVAEMDYMVRIEGKTARMAASTWMQANEGRVGRWFAAQ